VFLDEAPVIRCRYIPPARLWFMNAVIVALTATALGLQAQTTPARGRASTPPPPAPPHLVVLLVIDQFRADYVDQYGGQWSQGLRRLLTEGAVFTHAAMPYAVTKTCAGHATIGTGTFPSTHGLIDNEWYDAASQAYVSCTTDPAARAIGFGGQRAIEHHSATWLRVPTLGDVLQQSRPGSRVVALALKARSAISLGGHGGPGAVIAWEEDSGAWATSSALTSTPSSDVDAYVRSHPATRDRGQPWNRQLPATSYLYDDRAPGELRDGVFPHVLDAPFGASFSAMWDASPRSDAYLADMAGTLLTNMKLGQDAQTDMLAIGFSALDYVGHSYGPRSHEVQDTLVRLDIAIGTLLAQLDRVVGRDDYVVALTSDHGVAPLPEQAEAITGMPGGRLNLNAIGLAVDVALESEFGRHATIATISGTYVYFLPGILERIRANDKAIRSVEAAVRAVAGVERVYWSQDLSATAPTDDAALISLRRSYVPGRSGDLAFLPKPNWVVASAGTNHGSRHPYDTQVPLILSGAGVKPGRYIGPASPVDVAPTLAAMAGMRMPRTDGRVLTEALVH
jgi:predicted AlkP superfamily pyrophosphatase or phosphodiesterase